MLSSLEWDHSSHLLGWGGLWVIGRTVRISMRTSLFHGCSDTLPTGPEMLGATPIHQGHSSHCTFYRITGSFLAETNICPAVWGMIKYARLITAMDKLIKEKRYWQLLFPPLFPLQKVASIYHVTGRRSEASRRCQDPVAMHHHAVPWHQSTS